MRKTFASSQRGAVLLLALALMLAIALIGVAVLRVAGNDRMEAARMGVKERGQMCAEAGLQYGRRFFGLRYEVTHNWNDYLNGGVTGFGKDYRYDPSLGDVPDIADRPMKTKGQSNGTSFDTGADLDGDGKPDFWVSIRDDDDEAPLGATDDRTRDNNETVILRSECINPQWQVEVGGTYQDVVLEAVLTHVQGASGYGNAQITSNSPDIVGTVSP